MYLCSNKSCSIMDDKHIHVHEHEHEHEHEHKHEHEHELEHEHSGHGHELEQEPNHEQEHCEHCHEHHHGHEHHHHHEEEEGRGRLAKIIAATVLLIGAVIIEKYTAWETWQYLLLYLIPYLVVGWDTLKEAETSS